MAYCAFANKNCPVKWAVLGLKEGIFPEESTIEGVSHHITNEAVLGSLCSLVESLIEDGECIEGPELEYATESTVFVRCQNSSHEAIMAVTDDAFNLLITTVESPDSNVNQ